MLEVVYIMRGGTQYPNPNVDVTDKTVLIPYIEAFEKATQQLVDTGEIVEEYCYYFEQLEAVANIYPLYPYEKLERKHIDEIGQFFNKIQLRKDRINKYLRS